MNLMAKLLHRYDDNARKQLKFGDHVRWIIDVDKIYSQHTKLYAMAIGTIVEPKDRAWICENKGNLPGTFDVEFPHMTEPNKTFTVWNIPYSDLRKVKVKWDYDLGRWYNPMSDSL